MKVYTKTGDKGTTGLFTGERIDKDSPRVEAYGTIDEINSVLGLARVWCVKSESQDSIYSLQKILMMIMAELASINSNVHYIKEEHVKQVEEIIDKIDAQLPSLSEFIIPGGAAGAATLDLARTVTRRAERQVIKLAKQEVINEQALILLNRLSDLCFVLARYELN